jgi:hypothetical protein
MVYQKILLKLLQSYLTELCRSPFFTKSKISFIKILNITGPRTDPWGTPLYISRKELQTDPILTQPFTIEIRKLWCIRKFFKIITKLSYWKKTVC